MLNKTEKTLAKIQLTDEQKTLRELRQVYRQAKKDVEENIRSLSARTDLENVQSIVYQKNIQEILKKQIDAGLKDLESGQFNTIEEFLQVSYQNGYLGSMYNFQQQGIPILSPIDQKKVIRALQTDSKLSSRYYKGNPLKGRCAEDIQKLKKSIRAELSRGISNGSTWNQVAFRIASGMNNPFDRSMNDAMRIARTEGHRVNQEGFLDAGDEAVKKGADVVKQWDATLDSKTRPAHQEADGQIREWNDDFLVGGEHMKAPSIGGSAGNVINCRCQLLQRARWALDEDELKQLQERAKYFGLDKTKDFDDFRKKYLKLPKNVDDIKVVLPKNKGSDVTGIRENINVLKTDKSEKDKLLVNNEGRLDHLKRNQFFIENRDLDFFKNKIDTYKDRPEIFGDQIQYTQWVIDNWDELKSKGVDHFISEFEDNKKALKKEISALKRKLKKEYDELEKHIGTPVMSTSMMDKYGSKHITEICHFLDDAPDDYRKAWDTVAGDFNALTRRKGLDKTTDAFYSPSRNGVLLSINSASKGDTIQTPYQVVFHEYGHHMDYVFNRRYGNGNPMEAFTETYKDGIFGKTLKKEANKAIEDFAKKNNLYTTPERIDVERDARKMVLRGLMHEDEMDDYVSRKMKETIIDRETAEKEFAKHIKKNYSSIERSDISDMFEPVYESGAYPFGAGHGKSYWSSRDNGKEGFAEMYSAKVANEGSWNTIQEYFPESVEIFEEMLKVVE